MGRQRDGYISRIGQRHLPRAAKSKSKSLFRFRSRGPLSPVGRAQPLAAGTVRHWTCRPPVAPQAAAFSPPRAPRACHAAAPGRQAAGAASRAVVPPRCRAATPPPNPVPELVCGFGSELEPLFPAPVGGWRDHPQPLITPLPLMSCAFRPSACLCPFGHVTATTYGRWLPAINARPAARSLACSSLSSSLVRRNRRTKGAPELPGELE